MLTDMNILHIPHNQGTSEEADVTLLKLLGPLISRHQLHGNDCSHMNDDTCIPLRNVAEE